MSVHSVTHGMRPGRTWSNGVPTVRKVHGDGVLGEGFQGEKVCEVGGVVVMPDRPW